VANWSEPASSRTAVDKAAWALVDPAATRVDREIALFVVNNWRSSHAFPLNTIQMSLRRRAALVDPDVTVSQRIKRLPSITQKLERYPGMRLSRMQDIGGCRAVLADANAVRKVFSLYREGNGKHELIRVDDYMDEKPKESGYRGVHLVYKYRSDRKATYNGLSVEVQLRTRWQHAWATAVETVGFFTSQALKSSAGSEDWLRFFALMSSEIAGREGTPPVPGTPGDEARFSGELLELTLSLGVVERLTAYGATLKVFEERTAGGSSKYFVLRLNAAERTLNVYSFGSLAQATGHYEALERAAGEERDTDVVLVSVDSISALRRAYPNYFLDTGAFLRVVRDATT
jgi:Region found in RelA / SpoT proteins